VPSREDQIKALNEQDWWLRTTTREEIAKKKRRDGKNRYVRIMPGAASKIDQMTGRWLSGIFGAAPGGVEPGFVLWAGGPNNKSPLVTPVRDEALA
jgi:hypothetical protein